MFKRSFLPFILAFFMLSAFVVKAQTTIKGNLVDSSTNEPVIGANVSIIGTTTGAISDFDGNFAFESKLTDKQTVLISFVGMKSFKKEVTLNGSTIDLGQIALETDAIGLSEVEVLASVAIDRKTPVAVSSVGVEEIEAKLSNQDFPAVLKSSPGVYVSGAGGGFGDSRIALRGFDSQNVAVMVNGVPVNDMENGTVYWSNWAGLGDVTKTMQVQRGLGASKLAVPSVGGTVNIVTKTTDAQKGGSVYAGMGNDGYYKTGLSLSTGLMDNGWAVTVLGSRSQGNGYVDGTEFTGYSYFANISKQINDKHTLSFTAFGAPQDHGQRQSRLTEEEYDKYGKRYNKDWGYREGEAFNAETNHYHKPQMSLNHYWTINEKTDLSTAVYVSIGRGGGTGITGSNYTNNYRNEETGLVEWDDFIDNNVNDDGSSKSVIYDSKNEHFWTGALSTLTHEINDNWTFTGGLDLRYYMGNHYRTIEDLMGGEYYDDKYAFGGQGQHVEEGDTFSYSNDGLVQWQGLFGQIEYSKDKLSAFASVAASHQAYKRIDYLGYENTESTDWASFFGGSVKAGANYNIDDHHNVFVNGGFISRQPFFDAVYINHGNNLNPEAKNETIYSGEVGYGYRRSGFSLNVNGYYTMWKDRTTTASWQDPETGNWFDANLLGVNARHMGIEVDAKYQITKKLTVGGMLSLGNWEWMDDIDGVQFFDDNNQPIGDTQTLYLEGLKVGNAAQTTAAINVSYEVLPKLRLMGDVNYFGNLYADYDVEDRIDPSYESAGVYEIPSYFLVDLGIMYSFKIGKLDFTANGNINNLLDEDYIVQGQEGGLSEAGQPTMGTYYMGVGRTYSFGLKMKF